MTKYRFSVEIDSTNKPDDLLTELRRICELTFPEVRVHRTVTSKVAADVTRAWPELTKMKRKLEAELGYSPTID